MRKKIIWIGNSAGFVIDRSLRALLGLRVGTFVDIETDGRTLIIQRSKVQDDETGSTTSNEKAVDGVPGSVTEVERKRLVMRAHKISETLLHHSVPFEVVRDLFHAPMPEPEPGKALAWMASLRPYLSWADSRRQLESSPVEIATMQRFEALLQHRGEDWFGGSWEESAEVALAQVPMVRQPDYVEPQRSTKTADGTPRSDTPRPSLLDQLLGEELDESYDDAWDQSVSS